MKKLILISFFTLLKLSSNAQTWNETLLRTHNFQEIKEKLLTEKEDENESNGKNSQIEEDENYHTNRWLYYWENHLDEKGNLVSPIKTQQEWTKYYAKTKKSVLKTTSNQSQWTFQGPTTSSSGYRGLGRVNIIAFHPTDSNVLIAGTAGGGAWRTLDGGLTWSALYNDLPVLSVSDIDYNPMNPNTIYLSTGDHDGSDTYSIGLLKSFDGGNTWDSTGLLFGVNDFKLIHKLLINPLDTNSLLIATNYNLKKTFDGGNTWTDVASGNFKDIVYHPSDTNIIYATANGNGNANIFRSLDGGLNWNIVQSFPTDGGRIALAVTPIDPAIVKAVVSRSSNNGLYGIYNSVDAGASFNKIYGDTTDCSLNILNGSLNLDPNTCSGQSWYDLCIAINPSNANQVLIGSVNTYQSFDGGVSWNMVTQWYNGSPGIKTVHADKHFLGFNPNMQNTLFEGNDGGIYKTSNPMSLVWNDLSNGMGITQFYRNAVSDIANYVVGGAQDNGSKQLRLGNFSDELSGGDGMDCQLDDLDTTIFYTSVQYGKILITTDGGANFNNISDNITGNPTGAWVTPFVLTPQLSGQIVAGYDHVYFSNDYGQSWLDISPNFPTSNYKIQRIANSFLNSNELVTVGGTNYINYTFDMGQQWTNLICTYSGKISDVAIDPWDSNKFWFTFSGYNNTKVASYKLGVGWSQHNDSLPNLPVNCIVIDSSNGTKYIGTDVAVFYQDTSMNAWRLYNNDLPSVVVNDLGINYATNDIWAATFGRGMWKSPRHTTLPPVSIQTIPFATDVIQLFPNPNKGLVSVVTNNSALMNQNVTLVAINYEGKVVATIAKKFDETGRLQFDASSFPKGNYLVEVLKNDVVFAKEKMLMY